jgi:hypothetical protein
MITNVGSNQNVPTSLPTGWLLQDLVVSKLVTDSGINSICRDLLSVVATDHTSRKYMTFKAVRPPCYPN